MTGEEPTMGNPDDKAMVPFLWFLTAEQTEDGLEPREVARDELREERVGEQREWVLFRGRKERVKKYYDEHRRRGKGRDDGKDEEGCDRRRADEKLGPRRAEKSRRRGEFDRRRSAETVNSEAKKTLRSDDEQTRERQRGKDVSRY